MPEVDLPPPWALPEGGTRPVVWVATLGKDYPLDIGDSVSWMAIGEPEVIQMLAWVRRIIEARIAWHGDRMPRQILLLADDDVDLREAGQLIEQHGERAGVSVERGMVGGAR